MLALVLAVASLVSTGAAVTCYNLAGDVADNNTPCNPDADDSLCCAPYDICLSNNLCYYTEGNELSRGACTDRTFSADACTPLLADGGHEGVCNSGSSSFGVTRCNSESQYKGLFICDDTQVSDSICNGTIESDSIINLAPGFFADKRNASSSATAGTVTSTVTSMAAATAGGAGATTTVTVSGTGVGALPAGASSTKASSKVPQASCPSSTGAKAGIGAGIGVPLAAALAGAVIWAMRERRLRKRAEGAYPQDIGGIASAKG